MQNKLKGIETGVRYGPYNPCFRHTARGTPAANLAIDLYKITGNTEQKLKSVSTNGDGRCDKPLLEGDSFNPGKYKLIFHAAQYLEEKVMFCRKHHFWIR